MTTRLLSKWPQRDDASLSTSICSLGVSGVRLGFADLGPLVPPNLPALRSNPHNPVLANLVPLDPELEGSWSIVNHD